MRKDTSIKASSRRRALKSVLAAGAAVSGSHMLPENWKKPVVGYVNLPAHAQTTATVFSTGTVEISSQSEFNDWWESNPLIDGLIPQAQASDDATDGVVISACGEYDSGEYILAGAFSILFQVLANNDVNICFQSLGGRPFAQRCTGSTTSTINGTQIANAVIQMIDADSEDNVSEMEDVMLSDMVFDSQEMTVEGEVRIYNPTVDPDEISCVRKFQANLVLGDFNCQAGCLPLVD